MSTDAITRLAPGALERLAEQVEYVIAHPDWSAHPIDPALVADLLADYADLVAFRRQILADLARWVANG